MKLWILSRTGHVEYDQYDALVVRANDEDEARKLAEAYAGPYPHIGIWLKAETCTCELLTRRGKEAEVILGSYNAG